MSNANTATKPATETHSVKLTPEQVAAQANERLAQLAAQQNSQPMSKGGNTAPKRVCRLTRSEFHEHAKSLDAVIDGATISLGVKEFSTGSLGWYANGKTMVEVNGRKHDVQVGITLTLIGSKELPQ